MKRYAAISELPDHGSRAIAIGAFDGVHCGHQAIVRCAVESARALSLVSTVITFTPNPLEVLRPEFKTTYLAGDELRCRLIEGLGVDALLEIPFTPELSRVTWEQFCGMLLTAPISARTVAVGRNFRFGHGGEGTAKMLRDYGSEHGVDVEIPALVTSADGKPISSTRIRRLIAQGDVEEAAALLARPHCVTGRVVRGDGRGAGLGIPTANIDVSDRVAVPGRGVYAGQVRVGDRWWAAAINVGNAPTFRDAGDIRIEAFLLDFPGDDIYGEELAVAFTHRLRNEQRFASPAVLVAQIERDIADARAATTGAEEPFC